MLSGLSMSGGSTKIAGLAGSAVSVCKTHGYKPDLIDGVSAGSVISVLLALGMYDVIEKEVTTFTHDTFFDRKPVNDKGGPTFNGILRVLTGKESLGRQRALVDTMKRIIPLEVFEKYKAGDYAPCFLGAVEYKTGSRKYFPVKEMSYDMYMEAMLASASIPIMIESVKIDGGYWYDGGIRDHIGSHWLMEQYPHMDQHISIYSRPADFQIHNPNWEPKNVVEVMTRTLQIMSLEISKGDEYKEDQLAELHEINNRKIFMPHILAENEYQTEPHLLRQWFQDGAKAADEVMR